MVPAVLSAEVIVPSAQTLCISFLKEDLFLLKHSLGRGNLKYFQPYINKIKTYYVHIMTLLPQHAESWNLRHVPPYPAAWNSELLCTHTSLGMLSLREQLPFRHADPLSGDVLLPKRGAPALRSRPYERMK